MKKLLYLLLFAAFSCTTEQNRCQMCEVQTTINYKWYPDKMKNDSWINYVEDCDWSMTSCTDTAVFNEYLLITKTTCK